MCTISCSSEDFSWNVFFCSLKLTHFEKFEDTTQALAAATATVEGKISKPLKKLLKQIVNPDAQEKLLVADSALAKAIKVDTCIFRVNQLFSYVSFNNFSGKIRFRLHF